MKGLFSVVAVIHTPYYFLPQLLITLNGSKLQCIKEHSNTMFLYHNQLDFYHRDVHVRNCTRNVVKTKIRTVDDAL